MRCNRERSGMVVVLLLAALLGSRALAAAPETPEERRQRLEAMTASEKEDLIRKKERFEKLPPDEQARLRRLHEEVSTDPQCDKLKHVMTRYRDWLKTLSAAQRAELESLPIDQRVPKIKELKKEQEEGVFKRLVAAQLPPEDLKKIYQWLEDYVLQNEAAIIAKLPPNGQRRLRGETDVVKRQRQLRIFLFNQGGGAFLASIPEQEIDALLASLKSPEAQKAQEAAREPDKKRLLVQRWIGAAVFARMNPPVSNEELQRFYTEDLDSARREQLELLPREEMQRELRRLYHWHKFRKANEGERPPFLGPGGPGGPGPGAGIPGLDGPKEPRPFGRGNDSRGPRMNVAPAPPKA